MDILSRLDSHNEFTESSEARQLRKDAAEEIRRLSYALDNARGRAEAAETKASALERLMMRQNSNKMARRF